jgi:hypothetical protein
VAYDPLWRFHTQTYPLWPTGFPLPPPASVYQGTKPPPNEARFASGIGFVRSDPHPAQPATNLPSAHGLQRVTNFNPSLPTASAVPDIFVSPEDLVLQSGKDTSATSGSISPLVPDMNLGTVASTGMPSPQYDWRYTWMLTGQQADATDGSIFDCDIVIFENRPFAVDAIPGGKAPFGGATETISGETVVEAVFGYTSNVRTLPKQTLGYGTNASRTVLLRWPATQPDPEVKIGTWIADVTYERNFQEDFQRGVTDAMTSGAFYSYQRCYWYQVAKRTQPGPGTPLTGDAGVNYREMTVWTSTPLRAFTLLDSGTGHPYHVNAALVSPYVVNVFSRTIYTR